MHWDARKAGTTVNGGFPPFTILKLISGSPLNLNQLHLQVAEICADPIGQTTATFYKVSGGTFPMVIKDAS